ncbi:LysM peptidoglycan-binding domain-containing protein [Hymenobacter sp. HSC-4F20]|uniref:LysM peptidoglycan-binding domain-containing protein n=1 Tax=Hymenobacter sp. HSC-4F20 TaxID=2864135 RepID=UPI001C73408C|nr:LysM peptidoglycan-binding domain-containing protein [Hymenobacter sp. HSC-4F20]MBX0291335.1 LysM peptidoglycan-binding domain-containing protein [Hymenobacter sp. HSC-4F20]
MGLFDFLSNDGEKKPVQPAAKPAAGGATDFFGNTNQAAATPAAPAAAQGETYTVVSGDSLSKIAKHHYGDAAKWHQIYEANKGTIGSNPDHIEVGQVLTLPKL